MRLIRLATIATTFCLFMADLVRADDSDQFAGPPYGATPADIEAALKNCAGAQTDMNICAWSRYNDTETALETATDTLSQLLQSDNQKKSFALAAQTFKQFRNATCAFDLAGVEGGSMGFSVVYRCRSAYNIRRTDSMKHYSNCLTQAISCELPYFLFAFEN